MSLCHWLSLHAGGLPQQQLLQLLLQQLQRELQQQLLLQTPDTAAPPLKGCPRASPCVGKSKRINIITPRVIYKNKEGQRQKAGKTYKEKRPCHPPLR